MGFGDPAVGAEVAVVLHGLGPVVREVLKRRRGRWTLIVLFVVVEERFECSRMICLGRQSLQLPQFDPGALAPAKEILVHASNIGGELGVLVDSVLEVALFDREVGVAGALVDEQADTQVGADLPVVVERLDVASGDAAIEMPVDVLLVLRLAGVDVTRQVEVKVVLGIGDFVERNKA